MIKIDNQFVDELFKSEYFCERLMRHNENKQKKCGLENKQVNVGDIDDVIEEIIETMCKGMKQQFNTLQQSNIQLYKQIQSIKLSLSSGISNVPLIVTPQQLNTNPISESKTFQLQTDIFFNSPTQEMKQIRNNIKTLQSQIFESNQSLAQSFSIQQYSHFQNQRQTGEIQFMVEEKIDEKFKNLQDKIMKKFITYGTEIQQRIQQLKKTITSVVEAMNDPQYWANNFKVKKEEEKQFGKNFVTDTAQKVHNMSFTMNKTHQLTDLSQSLNVEYDDKKITTPSTGKSISSLNKSINFGRTKIKSLFGFGGQKKSNNPQNMLQ